MRNSLGASVSFGKAMQTIVPTAIMTPPSTDKQTNKGMITDVAQQNAGAYFLVHENALSTNCFVEIVLCGHDDHFVRVPHIRQQAPKWNLISKPTSQN